MKKHILNTVNILLGAASLGLIGCHTGKNAAKEGPRPQLVKYGVPTEVIAMYGVPVNRPERVESEEDMTLPADTTAVVTPKKEEEKTQPRPNRPVVKYGVPSSF